MEELFHDHKGGGSQPIDPKKQLVQYRKRIQLLKDKLDDYESRCRFTQTTIDNFIQSLISMQKEITQFKENLLVQDQKRFKHLINGIRYAIPVLGQAKKERAKIDEMNLKCHRYIIQAIKYLDGCIE